MSRYANVDNDLDTPDYLLFKISKSFYEPFFSLINTFQSINLKFKKKIIELPERVYEEFEATPEERKRWNKISEDFRLGRGKFYTMEEVEARRKLRG